VRRALALAWLAVPVLVACAPEPEASKFWRASQLRQMRAETADQTFGWELDWFYAADGERLTWTNDTATRDSLVVNPAFEDGKPAAFVLTELWYQWPNPWDQPVYEMVKPLDDPTTDGGFVHDGNDPVFGVGIDSTFYSPFWHVEWTQEPPSAQSDPYRGTREILDDALPLTDGPSVLCPLVEAGLELGHPDGAPPYHPFTGRPLRQRGTARGWVDHHEADYFDAHGNSYSASAAGRVTEGKLYRFVDSSDEPEDAIPLALPPVLPHLSQGVSLFREYHVTLPPDAVVFDMPGAATPDLEPDLKMPRPPVDLNIDAGVGNAYRGRVALNGGPCFTDAGSFPQGCTWLDSTTAVEAALPSSAIVKTDILVTLPTLLVGDSEP